MADGAPEITSVRARRFECQACGACMLVVPRELLARRLYTASAIGFALCLWALMGGSEGAVRARVSPLTIVGATAHGTWMTLHRWTVAATAGRLFPLLTSRAPPPTGLSRRKQAERVAARVASFGSPFACIELAAFAGAAHHPG